MVTRIKPYQRIEPETGHERWIIGAFALAMFLHLVAAFSFGWIHIPVMALPTEDTHPIPFTVVNIRPELLRATATDPINAPAPSTSLSNTSAMDINPELLNLPHIQPNVQMLNSPLVDPNKVIRDTSPLSPGLPLRNSENSNISADIVQFQAGPMTGVGINSPTDYESLLIHARENQKEPGQLSLSHSGGDGKRGEIPGFQVATENAKPPPIDTRNLPKPIVVRMPADVLFAFNEATLLPEATPTLQGAADMISHFPQANVQVDGYSDAIGEADYNQKLSEKRAQAVQDWLTAHLPPGSYNFHAAGHGSTDFVVSPNGSATQQAENRRVELLIQALRVQ